MEHLLTMFSGDQNVPQCKATGDQNVPQYQKWIFELMNRIMKAVIGRTFLQPILSDKKYSMVEEV